MNELEKMKNARRRLAARVESLSAERERIEQAMREVRTQIASIDAAFETIRRFSQDEEIVDEDLEGVDLEPELGRIARAVSRPLEPHIEAETRPQSCEQAMRILLPRFPGSRVSRLVALAKDLYGIEYNQKTAGNCLWRMKKSGDAYRHGQNWYPKESTSPEEHDEVLS